MVLSFRRQRSWQRRVTDAARNAPQRGRELRAAAAQWLPDMEHDRRERGYRKWRKAVARTTDWLDEDDE